MGIRGIDIQVAIQRAADAEKIQQGETAQARAGEAGVREEAELERARKREQSQKPERMDRLLIQKEKGKREGEKSTKDRSGAESHPAEPGEENVQTNGDRLRKPVVEGRLDVLA